MTGTKTNERPGVRAKLGDARFSAYKAREVLDLIRGKGVGEARTILQFCDRGAAEPIMKLLDSAVANAANNNDIPPEELYVGACYADEGATLKRWRPRARGRATRIRKRTCHITIIVSRYSGSEMDELRARAESKGRVTPDARTDRARRVARSRGASAGDAAAEDEVVETPAEDTAAEEAAVEEAAADEAEAEVVEDEATDAEAAQDAADPQDADGGEAADDEAEAEAVSTADTADTAETEEKN